MVAYEMDRVRQANAAVADFMVHARTEPGVAWTGLLGVCRDAVGLDDDADAAYCYFSHISRRPISAASAERCRAIADQDP